MKPSDRSHCLACLALALLAAGCHFRRDGDAGDAPSRSDLPTHLVHAAEFSEVDSQAGSVVSDDRVDLSSRVVGFITRMDVREGERVRRGDILVEIDRADIDDAIRQGEAGVLAATAELADARHDEETFALGASQGWASNDARRKIQVRRVLAEAGLAKAEASLVAAKSQLAYTTITAPVDGVIVSRYKHSGDMAVIGAPILTIESRQTLLFKVFVPEGSVRRITTGLAAVVRLDALPGVAIQGPVCRVVPSGDPVTRRYEVDVALPGASEALPGMFGRAEFAMGTAFAIAAPRQALVRRGGLDGVFVVDERSTIHFRWVRLGGRECSGFVEVTAGLSAGERILASADETVREGASVAMTGRGGRNE